MNPKQGDVFKVLEADGRVAHPGHPFVVLLISGDSAFFSNITDYEKEDDLACVLHVADDPKILTKPSTFRYQNVTERPVADLARAIDERELLYCGNLASTALQKIIKGIALSRRIKPKYKAALQSLLVQRGL